MAVELEDVEIRVQDSSANLQLRIVCDTNTAKKLKHQSIHQPLSWYQQNASERGKARHS